MAFNLDNGSFGQSGAKALKVDPANLTTKLFGNDESENLTINKNEVKNTANALRRDAFGSAIDRVERKHKLTFADFLGRPKFITIHRVLKYKMVTEVEVKEVKEVDLTVKVKDESNCCFIF